MALLEATELERNTGFQLRGEQTYCLSFLTAWQAKRLLSSQSGWPCSDFLSTRRAPFGLETLSDNTTSSTIACVIAALPHLHFCTACCSCQETGLTRNGAIAGIGAIKGS
jgi:hypothetical protein